MIKFICTVVFFVGFILLGKKLFNKNDWGN